MKYGNDMLKSRGLILIACCLMLWAFMPQTNMHELGNMKFVEGGKYVSKTDRGIEKTYALGDFYIDATEVTNADYGRFVSFVKETVLRELELDTIENRKLYYCLPRLALDKKGGDAFTSEDYRKMQEEEIVYQQPQVVVYDTVWIYPREVSFMLSEEYFSDPQYADFPVVGVSYHQAVAYCHWRTEQLYQKHPKMKQYVLPFRLPTAQEFEYVSYGKRKGDYATVNGDIYSSSEKVQANVLMYGDSHPHPMPVGAFPANDIGVRDLCGNVAEWTSSICASAKEEMAVKGGSFNDVETDTKVSSVKYYAPEAQSRCVGFRCVSSVVGKTKEKP